MASQGYNLQGDLQNQQLRELQARQQLAEFPRVQAAGQPEYPSTSPEQDLRNRMDLAQRRYQMSTTDPW